MSKLKKIGLTVFIVVVIISAIAAYFIIQTNDNLEYLLTLPIEDVDISEATDGTYTGEYEVFPVKVIVSVTVLDGDITDITILEHQNGQGGDAETIVEDVVSAQSIEVDSIAGATYSSRVILLAIRDALLKSVS